MDVIYFSRSICLYTETAPKTRLRFRRSFRGGKFINNFKFTWITKRSLNSAFVWCEEYADLWGCYPPRPSASVSSTCIILHILVSLIQLLLTITISAIENVFRVCIAWYKHERGWGDSRQLCKPSTSSLVLHNCREFSQRVECLYQAMQTQEKPWIVLF